MKKKFLIGLIFLLSVFSCFGIYTYFTDSYRFFLSYEFYNHLPYENGEYIRVKFPKEYSITYLAEEKILSMLENGTGVIYFGYSTCPWCRNIIFPLLTAMQSSHVNLYYVDVKQIRDSSKIIDKLSSYLKKDNNDNYRLLVPDVYFILEGEILFHHVGTVDSYKNPYLGMSDEQNKELEAIYRDGLELIERKS